MLAGGSYGNQGSSMGLDGMDWNGISIVFGSVLFKSCIFWWVNPNNPNSWTCSRIAVFRRKARGCLVVSTTGGRRLCNLSVAANKNPAKARRNAIEGIFIQAYG